MPEDGEVTAQVNVINHVIQDCAQPPDPKQPKVKLEVQNVYADATKKEQAAFPPKSRWAKGKIDVVKTSTLR